MGDTPIPFPQKGVAADAGAANSRFTPGQVVWLKSGSPALTVNGTDRGGVYVTVDWFDIDHCACRDVYHQDQLALGPHLWPSSVVVPEIRDFDLRHPQPQDNATEAPNG